MPLTLRQLKNKYAHELGRIKRELGDAKETVLAQIQFKNRICFETYLAFLSIREAEEKESYLEFLDSVRDKDVPIEVLLCAAAYSDMDSASALSLTRSEYGGDLDIALQWAVIQFLDDNNQLKALDWIIIIKRLLDLGADPRIESTQLSHIISPQLFSGSLTDLKSAYLMALFFKEKNQSILDLLETFSKYPGMPLTDAQFSLIFPLVKVDDKSIFIMRPWFQWLEKKFLQQTQSYLKKNECNIVYHLAINEDFDSLTYLEVKHSVNVFWELLKRTVINHYKLKLPLKPTLHYLTDNHHDKFLASILEKQSDRPFMYFFIDNNCLDILQRVTNDSLYTQLVFDRLYDLNSKSVPTKTPGISLGCYAGNITTTPAFRWLETNNPSAIRAFFNDFQHLSRETADSSEARIYLANFLNIDCYYSLTRPNILPDKLFSADEKTTLASFYQQRAKFVLDFMFNQSFSTGNSDIAIFHDGKYINGISHNLHRIFALLQTVLACPKEETADAFIAVYVAAKEYLNIASAYTLKPDPIEKQFLSALASGLTDQSPLSQYVQREFDIHRICVPFLSGLNSNVRKLESKAENKGDSKGNSKSFSDESSIFTASMNPLWDRRLLAGEIFRFLGFDPPRQKLQEKKEAKHCLPPAPNWQ